ncbi:MAG: hypothetical protein IJX49_02955 [Clostridia bacterium]|nr:hypothetical protein [Clostridia bacterium]
MRKYFAYAFKKKIWALVVLCLCCALPYMVSTSSLRMFYIYQAEDGIKNKFVYSPNLSFVVGLGMCLTYLVPVMVYSFKMKKRSVDCYYALPLKKEKLYLAETLVGLCLVLIPFTVAYWGGFFTLLIRPENPYNMVWYLPAYFGLLGFLVCLYGWNAFVFTRANSVGDGIVFMLSYTFMLFVALSLVASFGDYNILPWEFRGYFMSPVGLFAFGGNMEWLIRGNVGAANWDIGGYVISALLGVIGYALLFFNLRFERAENAEQVSNSWFGYKVIIPVYTASLLGLWGDVAEALLFVMIVLAAIVATIIYQRKFRFSWKYWLMIGGALTLGFIFALING